MLSACLLRSVLFAVHCLSQFLRKLLGLFELGLQSLLNLSNVVLLHVSLASQTLKGLQLVGVAIVSTIFVRFTLVISASGFPFGISSHFLVLLVHDCLLLLVNLISEIVNLLDQFLILAHNVQVVLLVNLVLLLKSLLQRVVTGFQVLLLVDVLFLDVGVNLNVLDLAALHQWEKLIVNCTLQLVMVIDVLHNQVDFVFEIVDDDVIFADLGTARPDHFGHFFLAVTQVVYRETQ